MIISIIKSPINTTFSTLIKTTNITQCKHIVTFSEKKNYTLINKIQLQLIFSKLSSQIKKYYQQQKIK